MLDATRWRTDRSYKQPPCAQYEDEVMYRCHHCGAEVIRIFERHRSASEG
jgi:hypothetical protein